MAAYLTGLVLKLYRAIPRQADALVLIALTDWANDQGNVVFSGRDVKMQDVADRARMSVRCAQMTMRRLEEMGLVEVEMGGRGPSSPSEYRVNVEFLEKLWDAEKGADSAPLNRVKRVNEKGCKGCKSEPKKGEKGERGSPLLYSKEKRSPLRNPTGGSRARDVARPELDFDGQDWKHACHCADVIEGAMHQQAVVDGGGAARAIAFAYLAEAKLNKPWNDPWAVIVDVVESMVAADDEQLRFLVGELRRWPDGAYPDAANQVGGHVPCRIEQAYRRICQLRSRGVAGVSRGRRGNGFERPSFGGLTG